MTGRAATGRTKLSGSGGNDYALKKNVVDVPVRIQSYGVESPDHLSFDDPSVCVYDDNYNGIASLRFKGTFHVTLFVVVHALAVVQCTLFSIAIAVIVVAAQTHTVVPRTEIVLLHTPSSVRRCI